MKVQLSAAGVDAAAPCGRIETAYSLGLRRFWADVAVADAGEPQRGRAARERREVDVDVAGVGREVGAADHRAGFDRCSGAAPGVSRDAEAAMPTSTSV